MNLRGRFAERGTPRGSMDGVTRNVRTTSGEKASESLLLKSSKTDSASESMVTETEQRRTALGAGSQKSEGGGAAGSQTEKGAGAFSGRGKKGKAVARRTTKTNKEARHAKYPSTSPSGDQLSCTKESASGRNEGTGRRRGFLRKGLRCCGEKAAKCKQENREREHDQGAVLARQDACPSCVY